MALVMALGVVLIGVGLLGGSESSNPARAASDRGAGVSVEPGGGPAPTLTVVLRHLGDGTPAAGATVSLWRRATGAGVAHRRARQLGSGVIADGEGRAVLEGQSGVALELVAQARGRGPTLRSPLGALDSGESRTVEIVVERPPAPTRILVRNTEGAPLVGASIWAVRQQRPGPSTFPGEQSELLRRTNREGIADLTGAARAYSWILVDAAEYAPFSVSAETLRRSARRLETAPDRREQLDVTLARAGTLEVAVTAADGASARQAEVRVIYALDGLPVTSVHWTDRRGEALVRGLPAGVRLTVEVTARSAEGPTFRDVVQVVAGERKHVAARLGP